LTLVLRTGAKLLVLEEVSFDKVLTSLISRICWLNLLDVLIVIGVHVCVLRSECSDVCEHLVYII
jgi:hypothetical protein